MEARSGALDGADGGSRRFDLVRGPDGVYRRDGGPVPRRYDAGLSVDDGQAVGQIHGGVDDGEGVGWAVLGVHVEQ